MTIPARKSYLFICVNRRPDDNPKGSCAQKGADLVHLALKSELAKRGLAMDRARACTSSCLDGCAHGVAVLVEPEHILYAGVTPADAPEIVDALVAGGRVARLVPHESPG